MKNEINNEIFEALLKAAAIQHGLNELEKYPAQEEINNPQISEACEYRIKRMLKFCQYRQRLIIGFKYMMNIASAFIFIFGIGFIVLLQFEEVRVVCYNVAVQIACLFGFY